jgi:hypothetical protein
MQWLGLMTTLLLTVPIAYECASEAWAEQRKELTGSAAGETAQG